jgi:hypothetical protein
MKTTWFWRMAIVALTGAGLLLVPAAAAAAEMSGNLNLVGGWRVMQNQKEWEGVQHGDAIGLEATWGGKDEPIHFATDFFVTTSSESTSTGTYKLKTYEVAIGLRKVWNAKWLHPFAGAGFSWLHDIEVLPENTEDARDRDSALGIWMGGGVFARLAEHLNLGVSARFTPGRDVFIHGQKKNAGTVIYGFVVGYAWGAPKKK